MLPKRSEPLAWGFRPNSVRWGVTLLAILATATVVGGGRAAAQEQPPAGDQAVDRAAEDKPAADQERERLEARLRELRAEVAAIEKRLGRPGGRPGRAAGEEARSAKAVERPAPPMANGAAASNAATAGGAQLDLVDLANSIVDASGGLKQARTDAEMNERINKVGGVISQAELADGRLKLETAQKRVELLRGIAQVATESARARLEIAQSRFRQGLEGNEAVIDAQAKVKMLELIVRGAD